MDTVEKNKEKARYLKNTKKAINSVVFGSMTSEEIDTEVSIFINNIHNVLIETIEKKETEIEKEMHATVDDVIEMLTKISKNGMGAYILGCNDEYVFAKKELDEIE